MTVRVKGPRHSRDIRFNTEKLGHSDVETRTHNRDTTTPLTPYRVSYLFIPIKFSIHKRSKI